MIKHKMRMMRNGLSNLSIDSSAISKNGADNEFERTNDELKQKIMIQVEFYFSDENLQRHAYLLDLIRCTKLVYVSLKLITNFRYVKAFTDDYRVVAYCVRQSEHLELNEELTKVSRRLPVPNHIEAARSRRVVAFNFPSESRTPSIKSVSNFFDLFGDISLLGLRKICELLNLKLKSVLGCTGHAGSVQ